MQTIAYLFYIFAISAGCLVIARVFNGLPDRLPALLYPRDLHSFLADPTVEQIGRNPSIFLATNVCIQRNLDGLIVSPTTSIIAELRKLKSSPNGTCRCPGSPPNPWHYCDFPMCFRHLNASQDTTPLADVTVLTGATYMINCWRQELYATNPAHWMMGVSTFFEAGKTQKNMTVDNVMFHQCPDPFANNWAWGIATWNLSRAAWANSRPAGMNLVWPGKEPTEFTCMKKLYFDIRYGIWLRDAHVLRTWQQTASEMFQLDFAQRPPMCPHSTRIRIYQRSTGNTRRFTNLDQVISVAQEFTSHPVSVFSNNETLPLSDQVRNFATFDILITPHGSHITNLIFTPSQVAVIEVTPVARDPVFRQNAFDMGFLDYTISKGHEVAPTCFHASAAPACIALELQNKTCLRATVSAITQCDMIVNLTRLRGDLNATLARLCPTNDLNI